MDAYKEKEFIKNVGNGSVIQDSNHIKFVINVMDMASKLSNKVDFSISFDLQYLILFKINYFRRSIRHSLIYLIRYH